MMWSKQKTVAVTVNDFIAKDALWHEQFTDSEGRECLIQVVPDRDAESPREWSNLWTWSTTPGVGYSDKGALTLREIEEYKVDEAIYGKPSKQFLQEYLVFPLYLYRHGSDYISTSYQELKACDPQGFDSACMGLAYLSKKEVRQEYGWKVLTKRRIKALFDQLKGEVEDMNTYLSGSVYGVIVMELESETEESVWGVMCNNTQDIKNTLVNVLDGWLPIEQQHEVAGRFAW
jgi:hypothetical protein